MLGAVEELCVTVKVGPDVGGPADIIDDSGDGMNVEGPCVGTQVGMGRGGIVGLTKGSRSEKRRGATQ